MQQLEQAILRTVAYFDLFSYPLTAWEVWKWLFANAQTPTVTYADVRTTLLAMSSLEHQAGFYFLHGRAANVATRQERYRLALHKLKRARRYAKVLARLPFVRAVAVCNSLGLANARPESDIDFFIITQPGHVWTARLFSAGWAQLRKLRPQHEHRADTACLSFYITDEVEDLSIVRNALDPYFTVWLATLVPLYDPQSRLEKLWEKNTWVSQALPHAAPRGLAAQRMTVPSFLQAWLEAAVRGAWFERWAERYQQRRLPPNLRALANRDTRVVLNRSMLKFHDNDRREEYAQRFQQACTSLGV